MPSPRSLRGTKHVAKTPHIVKGPPPCLEWTTPEFSFKQGPSSSGRQSWHVGYSSSSLHPELVVDEDPFVELASSVVSPPSTSSCEDARGYFSIRRPFSGASGAIIRRYMSRTVDEPQCRLVLSPSVRLSIEHSSRCLDPKTNHEWL